MAIIARGNNTNRCLMAVLSCVCTSCWIFCCVVKGGCNDGLFEHNTIIKASYECTDTGMNADYVVVSLNTARALSAQRVLQR